MKILLCGCMGRMGRAVAACAESTLNCSIAAGVDAFPGEAPFPIYPHPSQVRETADVVIDFSNPSALANELAYVTEHRIPLVLATTGLSETQLEAVRTAAEQVPIFFSSNMSFGVAVLAALTKKAAAVLGDGYDIEIVEMHHNQKLDAPSGTALMLADAAKAGADHPLEPVYDRHEKRQKREKTEIGIASLRGGTVVGEHQVIFAGHDEVIELTHRAQSREIFAAGALRAARFLLSRQPGLYTMEDLLSE